MSRELSRAADHSSNHGTQADDLAANSPFLTTLLLLLPVVLAPNALLLNLHPVVCTLGGTVAYSPAAPH